ncbi:hypothetical protein [Streptomyces rhizosphaerihabitans]|nr:hypothetical protein [Streptomyces rhizosphaerihabitans]MCT9009050.1 hypothetical protein [Streptomyces rhizosphaerihabitans]
MRGGRGDDVLTDPALRPTGRSAPEDRGRPVVLPLLVVNTALALALLVFG